MQRLVIPSPLSPLFSAIAAVEAAMQGENQDALINVLAIIPIPGLQWLNKLCFPRDTLVSTSLGSKAIGEIELGELVRSFDFKSGRWVFAEVLQRYENIYSGTIVTIRLDEDNIEATANHPFWVFEGSSLQKRDVPYHLFPGEDEGQALVGRWVNSQDVQPGDLLFGADGRYHRVDGVELREEASIAVCNLTVREHHTFAVGTHAVLVHNVGWCEILAKKLAKPEALVKLAAAKSKQLGKEVVVHAHHIVMKTVPSYFSKQGRFYVQGD